MAYLDVISLDEAKTYLRIDDDLTEDNGQITSMIIAALMYVENYTNVHVITKDKEYILDDCNAARVYDFPINTVTPSDLTQTKKNLYSVYSTTDNTLSEISANIGYTDPSNVPEGLKIAALEIISGMYYQGENNSDKNDNIRLSAGTRVVLDSFKRFHL